jgi:surfeit locus 1 family protein
VRGRSSCEGAPLTFRPYPALTAVCAVLLAFLIGLGVWQLQRLQWKLGLIAEVTRNMAAPPISLDAALALGHAAEYRHVALNGRFDNARESYAYGIDRDAVPDYHVIVPFTTDDHRTLMVDRGIVPVPKRDPATRREGQIEGETRVTGVWRTPDAPGAFTPARDPAHRIWYTRDATLIAASDHISLASPVLIEADATPNPGGLPKGGQTQVEFRNEHLQYAITWFLMAAGLFGVYLAYHVSKGRLTLTTKD